MSPVNISLLLLSGEKFIPLELRRCRFKIELPQVVLLFILLILYIIIQHLTQPLHAKYDVWSTTKKKNCDPKYPTRRMNHI